MIYDHLKQVSEALEKGNKDEAYKIAKENTPALEAELYKNADGIEKLYMDIQKQSK